MQEQAIGTYEPYRERRKMEGLRMQELRFRDLGKSLQEIVREAVIANRPGFLS